MSPSSTFTIDQSLLRRLEEAAEADAVSVTALVWRLVDEGLRMAAHPRVHFRPGPSGRRPAMVGGPDMVEVIGCLVGSDVPLQDRRQRAADLLALSLADIDAALAYYAEFTDDVDAELSRRLAIADREEELDASYRLAALEPLDPLIEADPAYGLLPGAEDDW